MDKIEKVMHNLLQFAERQVCPHEETNRGGALWEICSSCGAKWADDEGGKPEFEWPKAIVEARECLDSLERRPESKEDQEAEPESVEWDGEGLPPVGTKCKLWESRWVSGPFDAVELSAGAEVEIGGHANFGGCDVACFARDGRTGTAVPDCFAPIQSHREKVIEAAFEVGASHTPVLDSHVRLVVEALAEEDMLKLPEEQ